MDVMYGIYLLFTLGCTLHVLYGWYNKPPKKDETQPTYEQTLWRERKAKVIAFLIVAGLFWFQDGVRHRWSPEAEAMKAFDKVLDQWEAGDKGAVVLRLNHLSDVGNRPWRWTEDMSSE